jgi:DNA-binding beta-propeller fold protein YncE
VTDVGNNRVEVFTPKGTFSSVFGGGPDSGSGQFETPYGVAIDPRSHYVYVSDYFNDRVE